MPDAKLSKQGQAWLSHVGSTLTPSSHTPLLLPLHCVLGGPSSPPHSLTISPFPPYTHQLSLIRISQLQPAAAQPSTLRAQRHKGIYPPTLPSPGRPVTQTEGLTPRHTEIGPPTPTYSYTAMLTFTAHRPRQSCITDTWTQGMEEGAACSHNLFGS